jgi:hypothetical protein
MFMLPPMAWQTTWPSICWSWPSMVTFEPPAPALADSDADDEADELDSDEADDEELGDASSLDEQPDRPATNAAPLRAISKPRFTSVLLW